MDLNNGLVKLAKELWPLHRTVVSREFDESLQIISKFWRSSWDNISRIKTGSSLEGGWVVPFGWSCSEAYIEDASGNRILSYLDTNLRVVSHSQSVQKKIKGWAELENHLHLSKNLPSSIPYVTSYYSNSHWGFCVTDKEYEYLRDNCEGSTVCIKSTFYPHHLSIAERHFGNQENYIIVATYLCHPSMANNELSGPLVLAGLVKIVEENMIDFSLVGVKFVVWPETIGPIAFAYLRNKNARLGKVQPVITLTCLGLTRDSFELILGKNESWNNEILNALDINRKDVIPWSKRGSDERQLNFPSSNFCSVTIARGLFGSYPEYHTSADNLSLLDFDSLTRVTSELCMMLKTITKVRRPFYLLGHEPFLSSLGVYSEISLGGSKSVGKDLVEIFFYCDGLRSESEIQDKLPQYSRTYVLDLINFGYEKGFLL